MAAGAHRFCWGFLSSREAHLALEGGVARLQQRVLQREQPRGIEGQHARGLTLLVGGEEREEARGEALLALHQRVAGEIQLVDLHAGSC